MPHRDGSQKIRTALLKNKKKERNKIKESKLWLKINKGKENGGKEREKKRSKKPKILLKASLLFER